MVEKLLRTQVNLFSVISHMKQMKGWGEAGGGGVWVLKIKNRHFLSFYDASD